MTTDISGRPYARLNKLKAGDTVEVDGDFTCIPNGALRKVYEKGGRLFIRCGGPFESEETKHAPQTHDHGLDGQLNRSGFLIGVYYVR